MICWYLQRLWLCAAHTHSKPCMIMAWQAVAVLCANRIHRRRNSVVPTDEAFSVYVDLVLPVIHCTVVLVAD